MLSRRYVGQPDDRPVFPDSRDGWRDRSNVGRDLRTARAGTEFAWVRSHTARRTVATLLDDQDMTARSIADQLGHARPSMTQDVYMGRRVIDTAIGHLDGLAPEATGACADEGTRGPEVVPDQGEHGRDAS